MGIKKTLGLGVASAALGLSLIGGGTFAYFSDTAQSTATFAAGTLDLNSDPSVIVNIPNLKPGDTVTKSFKLKNDGSLDIGSIILNTSTQITDAKGDNYLDLAEFIKVKFLRNNDKGVPIVSPENVVYETTLAALKSQHPDLVKNTGWDQLFTEASGIKAGTNDSFSVQFEFVENNQDQNIFQGDSLTLTWDFVAKQGAKKDY
ncbi:MULTISPECIES: TasA family protein [Paenibacillus]|jgi:spore coat-associated protein N|uniref:Cell division protein FtsN n=1 Tax=Paenibacillus odorifer TaxID=189426 RepID=A0A1R0WYI2_9BACL|nr:MULTISPECIES: TasA family protein [Paenibacillus]AIQ72126.1 cell division protein FtsN [Paenibacillus odorifer]AWV31491.1 cell division protein FtsN [Paenibacillus odorifer]ETT58509.1 spore coat-associated protein [Paenibacillus sp. FSL H8-237]MDH6429388.1 spore coat-associated protein N [Paenibacillus sp. PastH-4]MDH6445595.1 spore coat-associated protein N [Paenibacillus sp. PastF-4]